jgi:uncharacterized protein (TIGR01244 family)
MSIEDAYNFRRIDDRLTTSGFVTAEQLRALGESGYDAVINLLPDDHDQALADEDRIVTEADLDYVHIPVDFAAPTSVDLDAFAAAMDAHAGQTLHVHCAANWRVSAFYALYAQRKGWCSETEADQLMRDLWDPDDHPAWRDFVARSRQCWNGTSAF